MTDTELKEFQLEVLGHKGVGFTEYRNINGGQFVGINPRKTTTGTTNQDVVKITCIVIDLDPISGGLGFTSMVNAIIAGECYSSYVLVSSGRGVHLYVPADLPINTDLKGYFEYLRATYPTPGYYIDKIHDLARVIRVWGSINEKNGKRCEIIANHFNGKNTLKLPVYKPVNKEINSDSIINGNRNNTFTSLAGSMRRKGMSHASILAALNTENKLKCNPPLCDSEIQTIAANVSRYEPQNEIQTKSLLNYNDKYLSNLLARQPGYSTGFKQLDQMLAGLQRGKLYVIAARTNEGKTSFATQIAYNLVAANTSVLYFPTELGYEPLFDKIVAQVTGIGLRQFQFGNFKEEEKTKLTESLKTLKQLPFFVHEDFGLTLETIKQKSNEVRPSVIIIDFIQAMKFEANDTGQQAGEIAKIMRGLKQLNEELNVPIIVCCQFNRAAINNELSLSHLKGSGSIEEFSDVVIALSTLSRFEYPRPVDLYILKSRYSEIGRIKLNFFSSIGKFEEKNDAN